MGSPSLNDKTLELLRNRPRHVTYANIAEALAEICPQATEIWLQNYVAGRTTFPHADRVQAVYEYLSGNKLFND